MNVDKHSASFKLLKTVLDRAPEKYTQQSEKIELAYREPCFCTAIYVYSTQHATGHSIDDLSCRLLCKGCLAM